MLSMKRRNGIEQKGHRRLIPGQRHRIKKKGQPARFKITGFQTA